MTRTGMRILGLGLLVILAVAALDDVRVRPPAAAGLFYPGDPAQLGAAVAQYINEATPPDLPGRYMGCIVPHAAYPYSGKVAAQAFRPLLTGQYDRVIVLAPSHFAEFPHCSIPSVHLFRTPLGDIPLDVDAIAELQMCPLIDVRSVTYGKARQFSDGSKRMPLHENEYSIEVLLPFLQARLGHFKLVPILVGEYRNYRDELDTDALKATAEALRKIIDSRTFIVASTDLTHYGARHGFRPFGSDAAAGIEKLDLDLLDLLLDRNLAGLHVYLDATGIPICGDNVIELFMRLLPRGTRGVLLDYNTSGRVTGSYDNSVSYGSVAYYNPAYAAPAARRMRRRPVEAPVEQRATPVRPPAAPKAQASTEEPEAPEKPQRKGLFPGRKKADEP